MKQLTEAPSILKVPAADVDGHSAPEDKEPSWTFGSYYSSQIDAINEENKEAIERLLATDPILKAKQEALAAATADDELKS